MSTIIVSSSESCHNAGRSFFSSSISSFFLTSSHPNDHTGSTDSFKSPNNRSVNSRSSSKEELSRFLSLEFIHSSWLTRYCHSNRCPKKSPFSHSDQISSFFSPLPETLLISSIHGFVKDCILIWDLIGFDGIMQAITVCKVSKSLSCHCWNKDKSRFDHSVGFTV